MTTTHQWRFMWTHATGEELGAQWRDLPPTLEETTEWLTDFAPCTVWVERRKIVEHEPERASAYDLALGWPRMSKAPKVEDALHQSRLDRNVLALLSKHTAVTRGGLRKGLGILTGLSYSVANKSLDRLVELGLAELVVPSGRAEAYRITKAGQESMDAVKAS